MSYVLFTATRCSRCKIVTNFMANKGIPFEEKDMKADVKEDFKKFYAANRGFITRGQGGVEFPVLTNGVEIRQGIFPYRTEARAFQVFTEIEKL